MLGAILGDMIGSRYESNPIKRKRFTLLTEDCVFTDDTVMTVAVADATLFYLTNVIYNSNIKFDEAAYKSTLINCIKSWANVYPFAGYGRKFVEWFRSGTFEPYYSFGNGSAMRVSSIPWLFNTIEEVDTFSKWSAEVTHNHPEGIKGAMATARAIFYGRQGRSKEYIKENIEKDFGYNLSRSLKAIRPNYSFDVSCQGSVPEAITCFLESNNTIDAIRNAVSLGGDSDTQGAIAGSIAEAYYGRFSEDINMVFGAVLARMDRSMIYVFDRFNSYIRGTAHGGLKV